MFLVPNGSPYELDKDDLRLEAGAVASGDRRGFRLLISNRVGGQDELAFDGSSFIMHPDGELVVQMADWDEQLLVTEWERGAEGWRCSTRAEHRLAPFPEDIYRAMMIALRDYVPAATAFRAWCWGCRAASTARSSAAVAVDALGPDKVWGVMLPSKLYAATRALGCAGERACSAAVMTSYRSRRG